VPGPTALTTALSMCGLAVGRFCFEGFLTTVKSNRRVHLDELKDEKRTMVFYEAPHKLLNTLKDMLAVFGDREISIIKEITKLHEMAEKTTFSAAIECFEQSAPKGEFVLIVSGKPQERETDSTTFADAVEYAKNLMKGGMPASIAAKTAAKATGYKKSDIYSSIIK